MSGRWIRKDREQYLLIGVMIACMIGTIVSSYWHFSDRIKVKKNIRIKASAQKGTKEVQFSPQTMTAGATRYYKLDSGIKPMVPKLGEEDGN